MTEETQISTPTENLAVDTSSTVEPTETETVKTVDTSTEEPTRDVEVAETGTKESTLYAGKYKTVEELEKGYKESQKAFNEVAELKKQIEAMNNAKAEQELKAQQEALQQAQARGYNSVEQQEIAQQVALTEFNYYWHNMNTVDPSYQAIVQQNLEAYYNTGDKGYLDEAKRYYSSDLIERIVTERNKFESKLNSEVKQKADYQKAQNMQKLAESLKTDYADFLSDLEENEGKAEALRNFCNANLINSKDDMATFIGVYNKIVDFAKANAIKEYEAQKVIEATKEASSIDVNTNNFNSKQRYTIDDLGSMTQEEFDSYCAKHGTDWLYK